MRWSFPAFGNRLVALGLGERKGRPVITVAVDSTIGRRSAHMGVRNARLLHENLGHLIEQAEQLENIAQRENA